MNLNIPALCRCFITKQFAFPPRHNFQDPDHRDSSTALLASMGRQRTGKRVSGSENQESFNTGWFQASHVPFISPFFYREILMKPQLSGHRGRHRCWNAATAPVAIVLIQHLPCARPSHAPSLNPYRSPETQGWIVPPCMWEPSPECTQPTNGRMVGDDAKRREVWL